MEEVHRIPNWENEGGQYLDESEKVDDPAHKEMKLHWSKCPFCGASNGHFGSNLEEHRSRCRFVGRAYSFDVMRPNYFKMLAEGEKKHLAAIHALDRNPKLEKQLQVAKDKIAALEEALAKTKEKQ